MEYYSSSKDALTSKDVLLLTLRIVENFAGSMIGLYHSFSLMLPYSVETGWCQRKPHLLINTLEHAHSFTTIASDST